MVRDLVLPVRFVDSADGRVDLWLSEHIVALGGTMLTAMGFEVFAEGRLIGLARLEHAGIIDGCNGIEVIGLFVGFVVAYPGRNLNRVLFLCPSVFFVLYLTNIIRILVLAITQVHAPGNFDITHDYSTTAIFYLVVFGYVGGWVNYGERRFFGGPDDASNGGTLVGGPDTAGSDADGTKPGNAGEPAPLVSGDVNRSEGCSRQNRRDRHGVLTTMVNPGIVRGSEREIGFNLKGLPARFLAAIAFIAAYFWVLRVVRVLLVGVLIWPAAESVHGGEDNGLLPGMSRARGAFMYTTSSGSTRSRRRPHPATRQILNQIPRRSLTPALIRPVDARSEIQSGSDPTVDTRSELLPGTETPARSPIR